MKSVLGGPVRGWPDDTHGSVLEPRINDGCPVMLEVRVGAQSVGYLVVAAESLNTSTASFIIGHTDGFLCVAMEDKDLDRLHLPPMAAFSEAADGANYAVSVDAIDGVGTGISAHDRARTARALADVRTEPGALTRPGHVLPVRVQAGRAASCGVAEAALALMSLVGARPAAAYAAILNDRGEIADHNELVAMARQFDLPYIAAESLDSEDVPITGGDGRHTLDTRDGPFRAYEYWSPVDRSTRVAFTRL